MPFRKSTPSKESLTIQRAFFRAEDAFFSKDERNYPGMAKKSLDCFSFLFLAFWFSLLGSLWYNFVNLVKKGSKSK